MYLPAERLERPVVYLESSRKNKEAIAREIAQQDNVRSRLIALLSCVEPCIDLQHTSQPPEAAVGARAIPQKVPKRLARTCIDPIFGFMHTRIQSWSPFNVQVYVNGCVWLAVEKGIRLGVQ